MKTHTPFPNCAGNPCSSPRNKCAYSGLGHAEGEDGERWCHSAVGWLGRELHGERDWQLPMVCHDECAAEARCWMQADVGLAVRFRKGLGPGTRDMLFACCSYYAEMWRSFVCSKTQIVHP